MIPIEVGLLFEWIGLIGHWMQNELNCQKDNMLSNMNYPFYSKCII